MGQLNAHESPGALQLIRNLLYSLFFVGFFWALIWWAQRPASENGEVTTAQAGVAILQERESFAHDHSHEPVVAQKRSSSSETVKEQGKPVAAIPSVQKSEIEEILSLRAQYPQSRPALFAKILAEDLAKKAKREVEPHSLDEIHHRQQGALKVLALRVLLTQEASPHQRLKDLERVAREAQDPTLQAIAHAARQSYSKGRPFFEDYTGALGRLSIKD